MSYSYRSSRVSSAPRRRNSGGSRPNRSSAQGRGRKGDYIDPSRFIKVASSTQTEKYVAQNSFADFNLAPILKANLAAKGYTTPSPIQDQTIPAALDGRDVIGIASTGTGKTAAFALPLLNRLADEQNSRALIIAPTR